jgi:hypothetical protein
MVEIKRMQGLYDDVEVELSRLELGDAVNGPEQINNDDILINMVEKKA